MVNSKANGQSIQSFIAHCSTAFLHQGHDASAQFILIVVIGILKFEFWIVIKYFIAMYSQVSISNRLLLFIIRHFLQLMTLNRCRLLLKLGKFSVLDFYLMPTFIDFQHFQKDFSISTIIITINIDIYLMNGVNFQFSTLIIVTTFI